MTPIALEDLSESHLEKSYLPVGDRGYCDVCNWSSTFESNRQIWLCDDHARDLGHLW